MYTDVVIQDNPIAYWPLDRFSYEHAGFDDDTGEELLGLHLNSMDYDTPLEGVTTFVTESVTFGQPDSLFILAEEILSTTGSTVSHLPVNQRWGFEVWFNPDDLDAFVDDVILATNGGWTLSVSDTWLTLTLSGASEATLRIPSSLVDGPNQVGFIMDATAANRRLVMNGVSATPVVSGTVPADIVTGAGDLSIGTGFEGLLSSPALLGTNVSISMFEHHYSVGSRGFSVVTVNDVDSISMQDVAIDDYVPRGDITIVSFEV